VGGIAYPTYGGVCFLDVLRKNSLSADKKHAILNRLKTARGHLDGIIKLVEDDTYCVQVIKQIAAVRGALDRVSRIELENHLEHCLGVSSPGELHPQALIEPDVNLSAHPAPIMEPPP
jgi:DNA-binding FrmR family transcriptional regulator